MRKLKKSLKLIITLLSVFVVSVATVVAVVVTSNLRKKGDDSDKNPSYALTAEQKALVAEIGAGAGMNVSSGKKSAVLYSSKYSSIKENPSDWKYFDDSVAYYSYGTSSNPTYVVYVFDENDNRKSLQEAIKDKCELSGVSDDKITIDSVVNNHFVVCIETGENAYSYVVCTVKNHDVSINTKIDGVASDDSLKFNGSKFACKIQEKFFMLLIDRNDGVGQSNLGFEFYEYLDSYEDYSAFSYKPESFENNYSLAGNTFSYGSVKISLQSYGFVLTSSQDSSASTDANKSFIGNYVLTETKQNSSKNNAKSVLVDENYYIFSYTLASKSAQSQTSAISLGDFSKASLVYNSNKYFALFMQKTNSEHSLETNGEVVYFDYSLNEIARLAVKNENVKIISSNGSFVLTSQGLFAGKNSKSLNLVFDFSAINLTYNMILPSENYLLKDADGNYFIYNFEQEQTLGFIDEIVAYLDDNSMIFKKNNEFYIYYFSTRTVSQKINYVTETLADNTSLFLTKNADNTYNLNTSKIVIETNIATYTCTDNYITLNFGEGESASTKTYVFTNSGASVGVGGVSASTSSGGSSGASTTTFGASGSSSSEDEKDTVDWYVYKDGLSVDKYDDDNTGYADSFLHINLTASHCITGGLYSNTTYYDYVQINYPIPGEKDVTYLPLRLYYSIKIDDEGKVSLGFVNVGNAVNYFDHFTVICVDLGDLSETGATELKAKYEKYVVEDDGNFYLLMPVNDNTFMSTFVVKENSTSTTYNELASYGSSLASASSYDFLSNDNFYYLFDSNYITDADGNYTDGFKINSVGCEVYGESIRVVLSIEFKYHKDTYIFKNDAGVSKDYWETLAGADWTNDDFADDAIVWGKTTLNDCNAYYKYTGKTDTAVSATSPSFYILQAIDKDDITLNNPIYNKEFYIVPVLVGVNSSSVEYSNLINFEYSYGTSSSEDIIGDDFVEEVLGYLDYSVDGDCIASGKLYEKLALSESETRLVESIYNYYVTKRTKYSSGINDDNYSELYVSGVAENIVGGKLIGFTSLNQTKYANTKSSSLYDTAHGTYYENMIAVNLEGDNGNPDGSSSSGEKMWSYIGDGYKYTNVVDEEGGSHRALLFRSAQSIYQNGYFNTFRYIYCVYEPVEVDFTVDYNIGSTGQGKKDDNTNNKTAWGEINYLSNYAGLTIGSASYKNYYTQYKNTRAYLLDEDAFSKIDTVITYENEDGENETYENFIKYVSVDFLQNFTRLSGESDQILHYVKKDDSGNYYLDDFPSGGLKLDFNFLFDYEDGYQSTYTADYANYSEDVNGFYYFWYISGSDYWFLAYRNGEDTYIFYNSMTAMKKYVEAEQEREQKAVVKQEVYEGEVLTYIEIDSVRYYFQRNFDYKLQEKDGDNYLYVLPDGSTTTNSSTEGAEASMENVYANWSYTNLDKFKNYYFIATSNANLFYNYEVINAGVETDGAYIVNNFKMGSVFEDVVNKYKSFVRKYKGTTEDGSTFSGGDASLLSLLNANYGITMCLGIGNGSDSLGYELYNQYFPKLLNSEIYNETFAEVQDNFYYTRGDSQLLIRIAYDDRDGVFYAYYHESETHTREAEYEGYWSWEYDFNLQNTNTNTSGDGNKDQMSLKIQYNDHGLNDASANYDIKVTETFKYLYTEDITFTSIPTHLHYTFLGFDLYLVGDEYYGMEKFKTISASDFDAVNGVTIDTTEIVKEYYERKGKYPSFSSIKFVARWQPITISITAVMWTKETVTEGTGSSATTTTSYNGQSYTFSSDGESSGYEWGTVMLSKDKPGFMIGSNYITIREEEIGDDDNPQTRGVVDLSLSLEYNPFLTYADLGKAMESNNYTTANISVTGLDTMFAGWAVQFESSGVSETESTYKFVSGLFGMDSTAGFDRLKLGTMVGSNIILEAVYTDAPYDFDLYFNPMGGAQKDKDGEITKKEGWMNDDPVSVVYDIDIYVNSDTATFKYTTGEETPERTQLGIRGDSTNYSTIFTNMIASGSTIQIGVSFKNEYYYFRKIVISNLILKNGDDDYETYTITFSYALERGEEGSTENGVWSAVVAGENNDELLVTVDDDGTFTFGGDGEHGGNEKNVFSLVTSENSDGIKTTTLIIRTLSWPGTLNSSTQQIARGRGFTAEFYPASYTIDNESVTVKNYDQDGEASTEVIILNRSALVSAQPLTNISGYEIQENETAYVWLNTSKYCFVRGWRHGGVKSGYYRMYSIGTVEALLIGDYTYEMFVTQDNQPNSDIYVYFDASTDLIYYLADTQMEYYAMIEKMVDVGVNEYGVYCDVDYPDPSNPETTTTSRYYAFYKGSKVETLPSFVEITDQYLLFMREDTLTTGVGYASDDYGKEIFSKSCYTDGATSFYGWVQKITSLILGEGNKYAVTYFVRSSNEAMTEVQTETEVSSKNRYIIMDSTKYYLIRIISLSGDINIEYKNAVQQPGRVFKAIKANVLEEDESHYGWKNESGEYTTEDYENAKKQESSGTGSEGVYTKGCEWFYVTTCSVSDSKKTVKYIKNFDYSFVDSIPVSDGSTAGYNVFNYYYRDQSTNFDAGVNIPDILYVRINYWDKFYQALKDCYNGNTSSISSTIAYVSYNKGKNSEGETTDVNCTTASSSDKIIFKKDGTGITVLINISRGSSYTYYLLYKAASNIIGRENDLEEYYATSIAQGLVVLEAKKTSDITSGFIASSASNAPAKNAKTTYSFKIDDIPYYLISKTEHGATSTESLVDGTCYYAYRNSALHSEASLQKIDYTSESELKAYSKLDSPIEVYYYVGSDGKGYIKYKKATLKDDNPFDISFNNTRVMTIDPEQNFVRSSSDTSSSSLAVSQYYELKYYLSKITIGTSIFAFNKITREKSYDEDSMTYSYDNFQLNYNDEYEVNEEEPGNRLGTASRLEDLIGETFYYFGERYTINDAFEFLITGDADKVGATEYTFYFARTDYGYTRYFLIYDESTTDLIKASDNYAIALEFTRLQNTIEISLKEENLYSINTENSGNSLYIGGMVYEGSTGEVPNYTYNTQYKNSEFIDVDTGKFKDLEIDDLIVPFEYNTFYEDKSATESSSFDHTGENITYDYKLTTLNWKAYVSYNPSNTLYYQIYARSGYLIKSFNIYIGTPYKYNEDGEEYYLQNIVSFQIVESSAFEKLIFNGGDNQTENYTYTPANDVSPNFVYTVDLKHIMCDEDGNPLLDDDGNYKYCNINGTELERDEHGNLPSSGENQNSGYTAPTTDGSKVGLWYSNMQGQAWVDYTAQGDSGEYALDDIFLLMSGLYEDIKIEIVTTSLAEFVFEDGDLLVKDSSAYVNDEDNYYAYHDIKITDTYLSLYTQKLVLDDYGNLTYDEDGDLVTELDIRNGMYRVGEDGYLINADGKTITGAVGVDNDGNAIDADGELVENAFDEEGNSIDCTPSYPYILRYYPNGTKSYTTITPTGETITNGGLKAGTIRLIFIGTGSEIKLGLHIFATTENFSAYFTNARYYNQKTNEVKSDELETAFQPPRYADAFKNLESFSGRTETDAVIRDNTLNKTNKMAYIFTGELIKDEQNNYFSDWFNKKINNRVKFFLALSAHENDIAVETKSYLYNETLSKITTDYYSDVAYAERWMTTAHDANGDPSDTYKYAFYNNSENENNKLLSLKMSGDGKYYTYQLDNKTKTKSWFNNTVLSNIAFINDRGSEIDWIVRDETDDNVSSLEYCSDFEGFNFESKYYDIAGYNLQYIMLELGDLSEYFVLDIGSLEYIECDDVCERGENETAYYLVTGEDAIRSSKKTITMVSKSGYTFEFTLKYTVYDDGSTKYGYYTLILYSYEFDGDGNKVFDMFESVGLMGSNIRISYLSGAETYYVLFDKNTSDYNTSGVSSSTRVSTEDEFEITSANKGETWSGSAYKRYKNGTGVDYYNECYQTIYYDSLTSIDFTASLPGYTFIGWGSKTYDGENSRLTNSTSSDTLTPVTWNSSMQWFDVRSYFVDSEKSASENAEKFVDIYEESKTEIIPGNAFYVDGGYFVSDTGVSNADSAYKENYNFYSNYISHFGSNIGNAVLAGEDSGYFNPIILYALYKANTYIIEFDLNNDTYNDNCYIDDYSNDIDDYSNDWDLVLLPGNLGFTTSNVSTTRTSYVSYVTFDTKDWYYVVKENGADNIYSYADHDDVSGSGYSQMYGTNYVSEQIRIDMFGYSWLGWTYSKLDYIDGNTSWSGTNHEKHTLIKSAFSQKKGFSSYSITPIMNTDFLETANEGNGYVREISDDNNQSFNYRNEHITDGWDLTNFAPNDISNGYVYFYIYGSTSTADYETSYATSPVYSSDDYLNTYYELSLTSTSLGTSTGSESEEAEGAGTSSETEVFDWDEYGKLDSIKMAYSYYDTCLDKNCYSVKKITKVKKDTATGMSEEIVRYAIQVTKNNNNLRLFKLYANWEQNGYNVTAYSQDKQIDETKFGSSTIDWNNVYGDSDSSKNIGLHYFNNYSLAYELYYKYRPTRVGYDFVGWTFAYTDNEEFASVNSRSDVVYLCSKMLANYSVLYGYAGNLTTKAVNLFIQSGFSISNANCEALGDDDAINNKTRCVYVYPVWKVQTFSINISLNISKEELKNLHERDSSFALGLYEDSTFIKSTGVSSKFYTNNTEAGSLYNGSYYNNYYSDIVANVLFEINFDSTFDTAKLTFGGKTYYLKDLFATSAGYYFMGLMYKNTYESNDDFIVQNVLKSYLSTEGLTFDSEENPLIAPTYKQADGNIQRFDMAFYKSLYSSKLSVSGSSISSTATEQKQMGTFKDGEGNWLSGIDYNKNYSQIISSNFGLISFYTYEIQNNVYAKSGGMMSTTAKNLQYYSIMSETINGEYYLYILVNNTKYYVVFYNIDADNKIDNSLTSDRTFLYYNKQIGSTTVKYTVRYDSAGNAYYVDNSYGKRTTLNLKVAIYGYVTNKLALSATNDLIVNSTSSNGSIVNTSYSVVVGDDSFFGGYSISLASATREFTLYAHWEERKIEVSIVNGNNSGTVFTNNPGLSGYFGMEATRDGSESKSQKTPAEDANTNTDIAFAKTATNDDRLNFYDNLKMRFLPYFNGRYMSEITFKFDTLQETSSTESSSFIMKTNTVSVYFEWDGSASVEQGYCIKISNVYLNGVEVYSAFSSSTYSDNITNKFDDTISILSFLDKYGLGTGGSGIVAYYYKESPTSDDIITNGGRSDTNFVLVNLTNLMCDLEVSCKFSVQTFTVEIYKLSLAESEATKVEGTTKYKTIFASTASLLSASNYNKDNRKTLGNPYQSWLNYGNTSVTTISTDCAHDKKTYNVPYGYYVTNDSEYGTGSDAGLDYIYTSLYYYKGDKTTVMIQGICDRSLEDEDFGGLSSNLISWCSDPTISDGKVVLNTYNESVPIRKNTVIYGLFKNTTDTKQVIFYNWDSENETYVQYTNNLADYTTGGSKFNGTKISELPSSSMAQWYTKNDKQMKFLGYVYITQTDFNNFNEGYKNHTGKDAIITDMFKNLIEPYNGEFTTEQTQINGVTASVLTKVKVTINTGDYSAVQELNVLNVASVLNDPSTTKYYAIPIYSEVELKIDKDKISYNSGTLQFSTTQFISTVFEYTNQYTIFYDLLEDLRFGFTRDSSISESTLSKYVANANDETGRRKVETTISRFSDDKGNYYFYQFNEDSRNRTFKMNVEGSDPVYVFFYYVKQQGASSVYPFYIASNCLRLSIDTLNGKITNVEVLNVETNSSEGSTEWRFEKPENYSPIDYDVDVSEGSQFYNYAKPIDTEQKCLTTYEEYNRKLLLYIALQLKNSGAVTISGDGYKDFGLSNNNPDSQYGNIEEMIKHINGFLHGEEGYTSALKVTSIGFFKLVYSLAYWQVAKFRTDSAIGSQVFDGLNGYMSSFGTSLNAMTEQTTNYNSNETSDTKIRTGDLLKGFNPNTTNSEGNNIHTTTYLYGVNNSVYTYYDINSNVEADAIAMFISADSEGKYYILTTSGGAITFKTITPSNEPNQQKYKYYEFTHSDDGSYYYLLGSDGKLSSTNKNQFTTSVMERTDALGKINYIIFNGKYYVLSGSTYYEFDPTKTYKDTYRYWTEEVEQQKKDPETGELLWKIEYETDADGNYILDADGNKIEKKVPVMETVTVDKSEFVRSALSQLIKDATITLTISDINSNIKVCIYKNSSGTTTSTTFYVKAQSGRNYRIVDKITTGGSSETVVQSCAGAGDTVPSGVDFDSYKTVIIGGYTFYYQYSNVTTDNRNLWVLDNGYYYTRFYRYSY